MPFNCFSNNLVPLIYLMKKTFQSKNVSLKTIVTYFILVSNFIIKN